MAGMFDNIKDFGGKVVDGLKDMAISQGMMSAPPPPTAGTQPQQQERLGVMDMMNAAANPPRPQQPQQQPVPPQQQPGMLQSQLPQGAIEAMQMPERGKPTSRKQMDVKHGQDAIRAVENLEKRELSPAERRIVELEGFVPHGYYDSKGILTYGVGQTGENIAKPFQTTFVEHVNRAKRLIEKDGKVKWDELPQYLKTEFIQSEYRGDLRGSPTAMRLFREGKYEAAAKEFLNHDEYKDKNTPQGIKDRMEATANAIRAYA